MVKGVGLRAYHALYLKPYTAVQPNETCCMLILHFHIFIFSHLQVIADEI